MYDYVQRITEQNKKVTTRRVGQQKGELDEENHTKRLKPHVKLITDGREY